MSLALKRSRPAAPVRMVHLGLGNFYRAHQAWFTEHASDATEWGYAAFEGRGNKISPLLQSQDNVYTLAFADADGDRYETIECISATHAGTDFEAWVDYFADPKVAIASTTITEAGYIYNGTSLDMDNEQLQLDLAVLYDGGIDVVTAPARMVAGLRARRAAEAGPIALMSCDNLPNNGEVLKTVTLATAELVDSGLAAWIRGNVKFVTTMVDRITPRVTDEDVHRIEVGIGEPDASPVVAESFGEWVISGEFPAGRPDWESAGVQFSDSIEQHETRKLWLLNGSHSLLAYVGLRRGFTFVDEAIRDGVCRGTVDNWWASAIPELHGDPQQLTDYAAQLLQRYENPRIRYQLAQIGTDGSLKIPVRWLPAMRLMRTRGIVPVAGCRGLAAFVHYLHGSDVRDARKEQLLACVAATPKETLQNLLAFIAPELLTDAEMVSVIESELEAI